MKTSCPFAENANKTPEYDNNEPLTLDGWLVDIFQTKKWLTNMGIPEILVEKIAFFN